MQAPVESRTAATAAARKNMSVRSVLGAMASVWQSQPVCSSFSWLSGPTLAEMDRQGGFVGSSRRCLAADWASRTDTGFTVAIGGLFAGARPGASFAARAIGLTTRATRTSRGTSELYCRAGAVWAGYAPAGADGRSN